MARDTNRPLHLQGDFDIVGSQGELFGPGEECDGIEMAAAHEIAGEYSDDDSDGLFPIGRLARGVAAWSESNPAVRLLEARVCGELTRRDEANRPRVHSDRGLAQVEVLVNLEAAGHALLVTSTIEREIRRCERAARGSLTLNSRRAETTTREFIDALSRAPHPSAIMRDGLRLINAKITEDNRLSVVMAEPSEQYVSVTFWPRLVIAFAVAAIADERLSFGDGSGWVTEIILPSTRLKAISGGIPRGGLEVRLRSPVATVTAWI